ncbi:flexible cuticle protein 12-like [Maniola jurtina]|uniref:flexible cuticle protein 12-like n=1 Tax=Maniola jurtina TaxID=191418 RepID=UPI001E686E7A|nr:flexible cuticle protein 12-like [Maniola jurtina]
MKSFIVLTLFVAAAVAIPLAPSSDSRNAEILSYESDNIGVDGYKFAFKTSDGKSVSEDAVLKNVGLENEAIEVRGQYSYPGDDGKIYTIYFLANEFGYQPSGDHLPK